MSRMSRIRFLTLNVCFEQPETYTLRFSNLVRLLNKEKYGVVCLQEVVQQLDERLRRDQALSAAYHFSDRRVAPYYTMILVRKDLGTAKFVRAPMPSQMGRDLLYVDLIRSGGSVVTFGTVHLESEDNHPTREQQMKFCNYELEKKSNVILMGDFNFGSHRNYKIQKGVPLHNNSLSKYLPTFSDAWKELKGEEPGFTFEFEKLQWKFDNKFGAKGGFRFDRILCSFKESSRYHLADIKVVCKHPIGIAHEGTEIEASYYISDHWGLECQLVDAVEVEEPHSSLKRTLPGGESEDSSGSKRPQVIDISLDEDEKDHRATAHSKHAPSMPSRIASSELDTLKLLLGEEPAKTLPGMVQIGLRLPTGSRVTRVFSRDALVESLYWWACVSYPSLLVPKRMPFTFSGASIDGEIAKRLGDSDHVPDGKLADVAEVLDRSLLTLVVKTDTK